MSEQGATTPKTPRVDLVCIFILALEWIFFGSCHFADVHDTMAELPKFVPYPMFVAITTGMVEVTTGLLILLPQTRTWAAGMTLALLLLFLPALYHIFASDSAMPFSHGVQTFVRVILIPNHVLMALCAIHLLRTDTTHIRAAEVLESFLSASRESLPKPTGVSSGLAATLIVALVMLLANLAGFTAILMSLWNHATESFWAMMCLATGGLVGFLFGVPRINLAGETAAEYRPNSNIEMVSDWLCKIIVGVGLVEFHKIGTFVRGLATELGHALTPQLNVQSQAEAFALALIVYFFVAGMIQGYLLTRMYLSKQFEGLHS